MTATTHITAGIAFLAGLVSFVSPCVLPLVPAYLSLLTGESLEDLKAETRAAARLQAVAHAVAFVAGFSLIFIGLGLSASAIGGALDANRVLIAQVGGVLVVILGLHMMGMIRIPWLMMDARFHVQHEPAHALDLGARRDGLRRRLVALHRADPCRHSGHRLAAA